MLAASFNLDGAVRRSILENTAPHRLPLSDTADLTTGDGQEKALLAVELEARLGVDALIRLHPEDFNLLGPDRKSLVHSNLEHTTNEVGRRYAVVPIVRPGRREPDGSEVLPVVDLSVARRVVCTEVIQQLPLDQVTSVQFADSLPNIRNSEELGVALLRRYAVMFPDGTVNLWCRSRQAPAGRPDAGKNYLCAATPVISAQA